MSFNDRIADIASTGTGSTLSLQPAAGINWLMRNIVTEAEATLKYYKASGGAVITIAEMTQPTALKDIQLHCTNGIYYTVTNDNAGTKNIAYDGIVTNDGTIGDTVVQDIQAILTTDILTIRPTIGQEWVIHNIATFYPAKIMKYDGTSFLEIERIPASSMRTGLNLVLNYYDYVIVQNLGSGTGNIGYDGIRTK